MDDKPKTNEVGNMPATAFVVEQQKKITKIEDLSKKGSKPGAFIQKDMTYLDLTSIMRAVADKPHRKLTVIEVVDATSFIDYINEQKEATTRIFADISGGIDMKPSFNAIMDFQGPKAADTSWMTHEATLKVNLSPEMERWIENQQKKFGQLDFAEFLEDNISDIVNPAAAEVLEVVHNLHGKKDVSFRSAIRQENGDVQFMYEEETTAQAGAKGTLEIPTRFEIDVAPFIGSDNETITARFQYRVVQGSLVFSYKLLQIEKLLESAVRAVSEKIVEKTKIPVFFGQVKSGNHRSRTDNAKTERREI